MTYDFSGKVALVTGGGSGIGAACARLFARGGARVVVADVDEDGGRAVAQEVEGSFVRADVSRPADAEAMVRHAAEAHGGLDIAVNNAGVGGASAPTGEYPVAEWDKVVAINLSGVFYGMRHQLPAMLARGEGAIVNVASILGAVGFANSPAYVAAKHGVVGLTRAAALEYAAKKVRVNAVGPGFIKTPLLERNLDAATTEAIAGMHPVGRMGESEEVAHLIAFLASGAASFITGSYHLVDGGYTAQ
jgi:NAD(P)-dependent dehydrogenase (short-subunit alcohol dehydrogenase family)